MLQITLFSGQGLLDPGAVSGFLLTALKIMFLLAAGLYFIFCIVIVRQIAVMKKTLITPFSPIVQLIGLINLAVVGVFAAMLFLIL